MAKQGHDGPPKPAPKTWEEERSAPSQKDLDLLPPAFKWLAGLPPDVRPMALARQYPRIANKLAECWKDPKRFGYYIGELMIDHRGTRKGFPLEIVVELGALRQYYRDEVCQLPSDFWDNRDD